MDNPQNTIPTPSVADSAKPAEQVQARKRIPMDIPRRKLEVSPIPGYYMYWFLESQLHQAEQAGYEYVASEEVSINNHSIGSSTLENSALDSRVRVYAGRDEGLHPEYHVLMKLAQHLRDEDNAVIARRNAQVLESIFLDDEIVYDGQKVSDEDKAQAYVKEAEIKGPPLFRRPTKKARK